MVYKIAMDSITREIGKRLEQIRDSLDLIQAEMGQKLGKGKGSVSKYENGEAAPPLSTLAKYAELGGVTFDWIFTGKDSIKEPEKKPEIIYPLAESEKSALMTAESLIERFGLDNRFHVVEIHQQQPEDEEITEEEAQLLKAFRSLDQRRRDRLIEDAEDMVLARAQH